MADALTTKVVSLLENTQLSTWQIADMCGISETDVLDIAIGLN